jgi:hypothetical protein
MDATAWTVIGSATVILIAIGTSFRSLRSQGDQLREQMTLLRERMAHLEGLLEGLREAISDRRAA